MPFNVGNIFSRRQPQSTTPESSSPPANETAANVFANRNARDSYSSGTPAGRPADSSAYSNFMPQDYNTRNNARVGAENNAQPVANEPAKKSSVWSWFNK